MTTSCAHGSCCSPAKLWRQIQTILKSGTPEQWVEFCDDDRAPHVARVLCSQRLANDPSMYPASHKHRLLQLPQQHRAHAQRYFGSCARDLNGLQISLLLRRENMALAVLEFLHHQRHHVSEVDLDLFLNHTWGKRNTALHLAAYWGMTAVVQRLLTLGADSSIKNASRFAPADLCTQNPCRSLFSSNQKVSVPSALPTAKPTRLRPLSVSPALPRTSMLLKKAIQQVADLPLDDDALKHPPLLLSSSTSSSSSVSSLEDAMPRTPELTTPRTACFPVSPLPHPDDLFLPDPLETKPELLPCPRSPPHPLVPPSLERLATPEPMLPLSITRTPTPARPSDQAAPVTQPCPAVPADDPPCPPQPRKKVVRFCPEVILMHACMHGDMDDLVQLIQQHQGLDRHVTSLLTDWQDKYFQACQAPRFSVSSAPLSWLHLALLHRQEHIAGYLISLGVNVNATDSLGRTPLHYAAMFHLWPTLDLLAHHPLIYLHPKTNAGQQVYDCPRALVDQRRCRVLIERAMKQQKRLASPCT
ncbi:hypothetical protein DM01DRAFT_1408124 [Hesseltinella vesiculosa]|uniref:Ankyrin n=1 Tax=Hesseltinella vesiculosa TaxID=101127 RepID=A0A1X2GFZ2_9FUNG|nr:hypothetical protein DM01DRAFT_1408124 [Hesseltinella vesiculosa]